jgi:hypothetical protein
LAELLVDDFKKAMAYLDKDHKAQQVGRQEGGREGGREGDDEVSFHQFIDLFIMHALHSLPPFFPGAHPPIPRDGGKQGPCHVGDG